MPRHGPLSFRSHWPPPTTALAPQRHRDPTRRSRAGGNPGQGRTRGAVPATNISHFPLQVRLHPGGSRDPGVGQPRDRPSTPFPPIPPNSPLVIHHPRSSFLPPLLVIPAKAGIQRGGGQGNPTTNPRRNLPPLPPPSRRRHAPYPDTGPGSMGGATPRPTPDAIPTHPPQLPSRHPTLSFVIPAPFSSFLRRQESRGAGGGATPQPTPVTIPHPLRLHPGGGRDPGVGQPRDRPPGHPPHPLLAIPVPTPTPPQP